MKKSTRILAFLMAFAMLIGSFSVMGSAYEAYKGEAIKNQYNDIDVPEFTTEQAASMALDEVDRMLAKEQIYLNIYVGELDLRSVNYAITSIDNLLVKVSSLLGLLGSASELTIASLKKDGNPMQRSTADTTGNVTDVEFITSLLNFLGDNAGIFEQYVNGDFTLGIMNGFVADFIFDVRDLVIGLAYSFTSEGKGFDFLEGDITQVPEKYRDPQNGAITIVQSLLNEIVLGDWVKLDDYFDKPWTTVNTRYNFYDFSASAPGETEPDTANYDYYGYVNKREWVTVGLGGAVRVPEGDPAPDPDYSKIDITGSTSGYDFIETLIQSAFNYILVPVLNNQTRHALRKWCGVEYDSKYANRTYYDEATGTWKDNTSYNPNYAGEEFDPDTEENQKNVFNKVFNVNAYMDKVTVPEGTTLISNINDIFGNFLGASGSTTGILKVAATPYDQFEDGTVGDWTWQFGSNAYLFTNIANVAKYVLQETGRTLFEDYIEVPTAEVIEGYNDQQVVAFVLRSIFNASVDWMFVPNDAENQTILGVCYSAVEQLAYQDIPQYTYDRPLMADYEGNTQGYYDALIDQALNILLDVAVYNLNQSFDANPATGEKAGEGLIPYQGNDGDWTKTAIMVAEWAVGEYGPLLAIYKDLYSGGKATTGALTMENIWTDIDTILDSLIPIVGSDAWISSEISGKTFSNGNSAVAKAFIFDYVLKPVYTLEATNFSKIFDRNLTGTFANKNGVAIIANVLENVFDLLFPNVFLNNAATVDSVLQNEVLGTMVYDLIKSLGTVQFEGKTNKVNITGRGNDIAEVALPVVDMILGLSDEQEFEEMEIYLPGVIKAGQATTFSIYNGSSGINTAYTDASGNFSQDTLYTYNIKTVGAKAYHTDGTDSTLSVSGINNTTKFAGGDNVDATIAQDGLLNGDIVEFKVEYTVSGEEAGTTIGGTNATLVKTVYSYVGTVDKDDDELEKSITLDDGRFIKYESEIYLDAGDGLDDIESYGIRIKDNKVNENFEPVDTNGNDKIDGDEAIAPTVATVTFGTVSNTDANNAFVGTAAAQTQNLSGQDGTYFLNPFKLAQKADGSFYERFETFYEKDAETGEYKLDENGDRIPAGDNGGVIDGDYKVSIPVTVKSADGTVTQTENVEVTIHLYNSYGLTGAFNSAVAQNRQQSEYTDDTAVTILWGNYTSALKNAAKIALTPKNGPKFQEFIGKYDSSDDYENYYEKNVVELEAAIEALEPYARVTGVSGIKKLISENDGYNYKIGTFEAEVDGERYTFSYKIPMEYYEEGYVFFGERDYMPHLYKRYRDAKRTGQDLIDTQEIFVKAPHTAVEIYGEGYEFSEDEILEYNNSLKAAVEKIKNPTIIGSTEAAYAEHMLTLTSKRLIKLEANKSKLALTIANCTGADPLGRAIDLNTGASKYTEESWEDYTNALEFANEVNAMETSDALGTILLEPTRVNAAMSNLIESWKRLVESIDFTALDDELELSTPLATLGNEQTEYTADSYAAFMAAYEEAVNIDRMMGKNEENEDKVEAIVAALTFARENLVPAAAAEPTWEIITSIPSGVSASNFKDYSQKLSFVPVLISTTSEKHKPSFFTVTPLAEDGVTKVDDFIIGTGINLTAAGAKAIIDESSLKNCTVNVVQNSKRNYSTGALVQIVDNNGTVIQTYQIIQYGDIIADKRINSTDVTEAKVFVQMYKQGYKSNPAICAKWASVDSNGNGRIDATDITNTKKAALKTIVAIDQVNVSIVKL